MSKNVSKRAAERKLRDVTTLQAPPLSPTVTTRPIDLVCEHCGEPAGATATAVCAECLGPLVPRYDPERRLPGAAEIAGREGSLWRYREWLPFEGAPALSRDTGWTPLIDAPALAARLGVERAWIKNDTVCHPSLSFKDRVVSAAINAAHGLGCEVFACASTGNLGNAVAAHAARAGLPAVVLVPADLEPSKIRATTVHGAHLIRILGTYDDVNRLAVQLADRYGWGVANVNLRPYYAEGSKTVAFEIAEQLGWRLPSAVIAPMAGGSLLSKLYKGFNEFLDAGLVEGPLPRLAGAQATGCAPIARAFERGSVTVEPVVPATIARSLAIGAPADGTRALAAIRGTGGTAAHVSDEQVVEGIRILAETTGVFAESAGGVTAAVALALAERGWFAPEDEVVLTITGHGLKTPDLVAVNEAATAPVRPRLKEVADFAKTLIDRTAQGAF